MLISITYAQKKSYLSIERGVTISNMSSKISRNMSENGLGDNIYFTTAFLSFSSTISKRYPIKKTRVENYKIRYGYNIKQTASLEAGFGRIYRTNVQGADALGDYVNYLNIKVQLSTAYAVYIWKNKKGNAAVGIGPAVSFCNIKQENYAGNILSDKSYAMPGAIFTSYWNFVNEKSWFIGLRTDMTITKPAKTNEVIITNADDNRFISVSKSSNAGAVMNTIALSAGIKF